MSEEHEVPDLNMIIVKRGQAHENHPHGGAWKVAFADFMTAMMAFFLVLWIVNSTTKETRSSVARYFNPIQISDTTAARKGLKNPREADFDASSGADNKAHTKPTGYHKDMELGLGPGKGGSQTGEAIPPGAKPDGAPDSAAVDPITARDPFIALDEIAGRVIGAPAAAGLAPSAEVDQGLDGPVPFRDPFAPPAPVVPPQAKPASKAATAAQAPPREMKPAPKSERDSAETASAASVDRAREAEKRLTETSDGKPGLVQQAMSEAASLRDAISRILREAGLSQGPKLEVRAIDEGVLISLTDNLDFGMFAIGSAEPQQRVVRAMQKIGELLGQEAGTFVVRGHTDARPFRSRAYDNWRLSSARAQMAAYMLMRGKLDEKRIERIEGHADRSLRNTANPLAAENRRIEILLRRAK